MPTPPLKRAEAWEAIKLVAEILREGGYYYGEDKKAKGLKSAIEEAKRRSKAPRTTVQNRIEAAVERFGFDPYRAAAELQPPRLEDDEIPDGREVLNRHRDVNAAYIADVRRQRAKMFLVPKEPFGVVFFGDPHMENKGCDLVALERDVETTRAAGLRAVQMGDLNDNFHMRGKLASKQAANRMSEKEGLAMIRWLVRDSGVAWDAHVLGNHDDWAGTAHASLLREWAGRTRIFNWMGRLIYNWGDGAVTVLAAHDFKGQSQFNPLHAMVKRALNDGQDDLYVAAHRHEAAKGDWANAHRGKHYQFMRVAGYKRVDEYAWTKDFPEASEGSSGVMVVDPWAETKAGRMRLFLDVTEGAEMVQFLRSRRAA